MPNSKKKGRKKDQNYTENLTGNVIYYLRTQKTEKQHIVQAIVAYSIQCMYFRSTLYICMYQS